MAGLRVCGNFIAPYGKKIFLYICRLKIVPDIQTLLCSFFMKNSLRSLPKGIIH